MVPNSIDFSASVLHHSGPHWLAPISQLFMAATPGHCLSTCIWLPLASTRTSFCLICGLLTPTYLISTRLSLAVSQLSRYNCCMDTKESTDSHNSSIAACITVAMLAWCLLCHNLATDDSSRSKILALSPHVTIYINYLSKNVVQF
jgi:hypothetical protein